VATSTTSYVSAPRHLRRRATRRSTPPHHAGRAYLAHRAPRSARALPPKLGMLCARPAQRRRPRRRLIAQAPRHAWLKRPRRSGKLSTGKSRSRRASRATSCTYRRVTTVAPSRSPRASIRAVSLLEALENRFRASGQMAATRRRYSAPCGRRARRRKALMGRRSRSIHERFDLDAGRLAAVSPRGKREKCVASRHALASTRSRPPAAAMAEMTTRPREFARRSRRIATAGRSTPLAAHVPRASEPNKSYEPRAQSSFAVGRTCKKQTWTPTRQGGHRSFRHVGARRSKPAPRIMAFAMFVPQPLRGCHRRSASSDPHRIWPCGRSDRATPRTNRRAFARLGDLPPRPLFLGPARESTPATRSRRAAPKPSWPRRGPLETEENEAAVETSRRRRRLTAVTGMLRRRPRNRSPRSSPAAPAIPARRP